ncbi:nucleotidyltransferase domain-containing protein [Terrisporobacter petrolearius]|uniref:nucleotidyltransferase domain-containing protein n=1 Tax=Terrisporobacter petrolearius TaxID=1460447 RepID=UPI0031CC48A2
MNKGNVEDLFKEISKCNQVEAIALGGSRASGKYDDNSDYDVYVYIKENIPKETRMNILSKYCCKMEIENHYWEVEDNCTLNSNTDIDIIYRNIDDFDLTISNVAQKNIANNGYTTCLCHNLNMCKVLYDKNGKLKELKRKYSITYPDKLRDNIISKNRKLLNGVLPSYDMQIKKAIKRNDKVSINHRITEFLASYFDIIFAINKVNHPGEKKLIQQCIDLCEILPTDFEENINNLFENMFNEDCNLIIERIIKNLDKIIEQ